MGWRNPQCGARRILTQNEFSKDDPPSTRWTERLNCWEFPFSALALTRSHEPGSEGGRSFRSTIDASHQEGLFRPLAKHWYTLR